MKITKKFYFYAAALLIFIIYLFFSDYIFNILIKTEKEARLVQVILPPETNHIKFHIDEVKKDKLKWKDALLLRGWVFKEDVKKNKRDVYLVLKAKKEILTWKIENNKINRPDVSEAFQLTGGVHSHGFVIFIPVYRLKEDIYQIGFVIEDETGKNYSLFNKALRRSVGSFLVGNYIPGTEIISPKVSSDLKVPSKEINYHFDNVSNSGNYLNVLGWGFLKGIDATSLNSCILLKKEGSIFVFDVTVKIRKDVTNYFTISGLNLDSSGFHARILTEDLPKGRYRLGLYITRGDQAGLAYSDKYLDIGK